MNKVVLMGRLTRDVELRYTQSSNIPVANFTIAVNDNSGKEKKTYFFNIVAWNKTGEFVSRYFKKGQQVGIIGKITNRTFEDKNGNKKEVTEILAEEVYFADSRK